MAARKRNPGRATALQKHIAIERAKGKTIRQIAETAGVVPNTVQRHLADPPVVALLTRLVATYEAEWQRTYERVIETLEADMMSEETTVDQRMALRDQALKLMNMGAPPPPVAPAAVNSGNTGVFVDQLVLMAQTAPGRMQ